TRKGRPENRPDESFGGADARRLSQVAYLGESALDSDPIESTGSGATTPPMKPTLQGRGSGAALREPTAHPPESAMVGRSAVCTTPARLKSVADAGRVRFASVACSFRAGRTTRARVEVSPATSNTGPGQTFHVLGVTADDSAGVATGAAVVSTRFGVRSRRHPNATTSRENSAEARKIFI